MRVRWLAACTARKNPTKNGKIVQVYPLHGGLHRLALA